MSEREVDVSETVVVPLTRSNADVVLTAKGVSTCICLMVRGRMGSAQSRENYLRF